MRSRFALCLAAVVAASFASHACGAFPERTMRMVSPYPPGGGVDIVARISAQVLTEGLGQQVIVDNRSGASGRIGTELVAKAPADGYTLLLGSVGPNAIIPAAYNNLPYDAIKDFAPITLVADAAYVLVVHPSLPAKSLHELIALAKAKPGALTFASSGALGGAHLSGEFLKYLTRTDMLHVPYKGAAVAMSDLLGGQVAMTYAAIPGAVGHIQSGRLRALGVTGPKRSAALPGVPAIGETVKGFAVSQWYGVLAPAGTPKDVVSRIATELAKGINQPAVRTRLVNAGTEPVTTTPEQFSAHIRAEIERWREVIKKSGIPLE